MAVTATLICFTYTFLITSVSSQCTDDELFCQSCDSPCISCTSNDVSSLFYKPNCEDCECEFLWWWIPGVLIFISCISCACATICYHFHTSKKPPSKAQPPLSPAITSRILFDPGDGNPAAVNQNPEAIANSNSKSKSINIDAMELQLQSHIEYGAKGLPSHIPVPQRPSVNKKGERSDTESINSHPQLESCKSSTSKSSKSYASHNNKKHERSKGPLASNTMSHFIGVERNIADKSKVNFHHNKLDSVDVDLVLREYKLEDGVTIGILPWKGMTIIDESDGEDEDTA